MAGKKNNKKMKVTVNHKEENNEIKYPCLMVTKKGDELIILFYEKGIGTVIVTNGLYKIGERSTNFGMDYFKPYNGSITLSND